MEILKNNNEEPRQEVFSPKDNISVSGALELINNFFKLKKAHNSPEDLVAGVASSYKLPKTDTKDLVLKTVEELAAIDAKEVELIKEAKETGERYRQALQELQSNI
ncbi:MAG: hypothetical protein P1P90_04700 [Patescibacteria group bacterium]|nr:hypothetical protein [Patescibacteria group bacterium]